MLYHFIMKLFKQYSAKKH